MHLYRLIIHFRGDISVTCTEKIYNNNKVVSEYENFTLEKSIIFSPEKALEDMLYRKNLPIYAVAKMYKIELFNTILFPKGELFEDLSTIYKLYHKSSTIVFNAIKDYCYIQRDTSIVNSNYSSKKMIQVYTTERIIRFVKKYYPNIVKAAKSKCFITTLNHYRFIPKKETFKQDRTYCKKLIKKYRLTVFGDRNNKLIVRLLALVCFVNINFLRYLSFIYQYLIKKGILRLKRPI